MDTTTQRRKINKANADNSFYYRGAGKFKIALWYITSNIFFTSFFNPLSSVRIRLLKLFGAKVGVKCNLKAGVFIRYPWNLEMGDYVAMGEYAFIDNVGKIIIGNHVTISQGGMILSASHNYKDPAFNITVHTTILEDGVWICSRAVVCPGLTCGSHSILTVSSIATKNLEPYFIYSGNPAVSIRERIIE